MEDWVNKISFHAKLPPSLQLLRYDDIQKVRWCEEQLLYSIILEKHNIEDSDRLTNQLHGAEPFLRISYFMN